MIRFHDFERFAHLCTKARPFLVPMVLLSVAPACGSRSSTEPDVRAPSTPASVPARAAASETPGDTERELSSEARLETIQRIALARNPDLAEARARVRAARELAPAASRLPDPEFEYQLWAQPLAKPFAFDETQMHMFGLSQAFPAPGTLDARSQVAVEQATVLSYGRWAREQEVLARVRRAYAEYYRAESEYRIHLEHAALAQQVLDVTRAAYQGGRGNQQDVLRAIVELSRLHTDIASIDRDRHSARALLNTLMDRPVDAPLGPPAVLQPKGVETRLQELERRVGARPEVIAAQSAIRARESELDAARSSARWPSFMVGVQYMYMPTMEESQNYGVMLSMSLPWLNPRHGEEVRAAEATLAAEQSALSSVRNAARYELYDAVQRLRAAQETFTIIERDLLPQARQSFEATQAAYRGGQGDSVALLDTLRSLLDVRLERERSISRLESALADLERAAGGPVLATRPTPKEAP